MLLAIAYGGSSLRDATRTTIALKFLWLLDTVKPGLVHYDIGDCLRSSCNPLGEETEHWDKVRFDTDICQSVLQGYLSVARDFLTISDYEYMYDAIRLIAFERSYSQTLI